MTINRTNPPRPRFVESTTSNPGKTKNTTNALSAMRIKTGTFPEKIGKKARIAPKRAKARNHVKTSNTGNTCRYTPRRSLFSSKSASALTSLDNIAVKLYSLLMKTTIDLPEGVLHRAKIAAAQRKTTLKDLVVNGLEMA